MKISYSKKICKLQSFLPKYSFLFTLETVLKKRRRQTKETSNLTKHASKKVAKAEIDLN